MGDDIERFASTIDRAIRKYVENGDVIPALAEYHLQDRAHGIRKRHGDPKIASGDVELPGDHLLGSPDD